MDGKAYRRSWCVYCERQKFKLYRNRKKDERGRRDRSLHARGHPLGHDRVGGRAARCDSLRSRIRCVIRRS